MRVNVLILLTLSFNAFALDEARMQAFAEGIMTRQAQNLELQHHVNKTQLALLGQDVTATRLFVLLSFSMPDKLILDYMRQANAHKGYIVFQGFKDNNITSMLQQLSSWDEKFDISRIMIDPNIFEAYHITTVPSIILSQDVYPCATEQCTGKQFDKLAGSVSIEYALKQFASKGDLNSEAEQWMKQ